MRLYLAGNFTVTDEVPNEIALKQVMKEYYHRLCTFYYPKPADVIIKNVKPDIPKKIKINQEEINTKTHKALGENDGESKTKNKSKTIIKKRKIRRNKNITL